MRTAALYVGTAALLFAGFSASCSQAENKSGDGTPNAERATSQTAAPAASVTPASQLLPSASEAAAPPASRLKPLPPTGGDKPVEAEFAGYSYSYKKDGEKTVATFDAKLLPGDQDMVAGAVRDVIYRSYGDKVDSAPYVEGTGAARTIRIAGRKHQYLIVPTSEPAGEIHSLIITRLN